MRYRWVALVLVVIAGAPLSSIAYASVKPGAQCPKLSATIVSGGYKFTCIKSGKKLIWGKQVIQPATPVITPISQSPMSPSTPTPTPTPVKSQAPVQPVPDTTVDTCQTSPTTKRSTGTSTPIDSEIPAVGPAGRFVYRYVDEKLQRKSANGTWMNVDNRCASLFDPIRVAAFNSIQKLTRGESLSKVTIIEHFAPNFPTTISSPIKAQVADFFKIMSPILDHNMTLDLVLVTEKDQPFIETELPKLIDPNLYDLGILSAYTNLNSFYERSGTGGGTAGYQSNKGSSYYLGHTASFATMDTYWPGVATHESTHVIQFFLAGGYGESGPEGTANSKWVGHLIEGSANTVGLLTAFPNIGWYSDEMDRLLQRSIPSATGWLPMNTEDDALAMIKAIEVRTSEQSNNFSYMAGQIVWEYFIGTYGFSKFVELFKNVPRTANFNENLKSTIGIDKLTFYKSAAPYLLANWKRLSL